MMRRLITLLPILVLAATSPTSAQNVIQGGAVTPGHVGAWRANGVLGDGGSSSAPTLANQGSIFGGLNVTGGICSQDGYNNITLSPAGYHQLCLFPNSLGGGLLSYNAYNGAAPLSFNFNLNGTTFPFPGPGNGNVIGPTSPAPTAGDVVLWNGGTTVKDGGLAAPHVATISQLQLGCTSSSSCPLNAFIYPNGVWRDTYGNNNGSSPIFYTAGLTSCSLNAGAGDGGSQIPSADGKCWLGAPPAAGWSVLDFGAIADNSTNNTPAFIAANAAAVAGNVCLTVPASRALSSAFKLTSTVLNTPPGGSAGTAIACIHWNGARMNFNASAGDAWKFDGSGGTRWGGVNIDGSAWIEPYASGTGFGLSIFSSNHVSIGGSIRFTNQDMVAASGVVSIANNAGVTTLDTSLVTGSVAPGQVMFSSSIGVGSGVVGTNIAGSTWHFTPPVTITSQPFSFLQQFGGGILLDNVFAGEVYDPLVFGSAVGIKLENTSNSIQVIGGEISSTTSAAYLVSGGLTNSLVGTYLENNFGYQIQCTGNSLSFNATNLWVNEGFGVHDINDNCSGSSYKDFTELNYAGSSYPIFLDSSSGDANLSGFRLFNPSVAFTAGTGGAPSTTLTISAITQTPALGITPPLAVGMILQGGGLPFTNALGAVAITALGTTNGVTAGTVTLSRSVTLANGTALIATMPALRFNQSGGAMVSNVTQATGVSPGYGCGGQASCQVSDASSGTNQVRHWVVGAAATYPGGVFDNLPRVRLNLNNVNQTGIASGTPTVLLFPANGVASENGNNGTSYCSSGGGCSYPSGVVGTIPQGGWAPNMLGWYRVTCRAGWQTALTTAQVGGSHVYFNGSPIADGYGTGSGSGGGVTGGLTSIDVESTALTDYFTCVADQNSGGSADVNGNTHITYMSAAATQQ